MNVLIVEDNLNLAMALEEILRQNNYTVDCTDNGDDGIYYGVHNAYDLMIMDVMLGTTSGYDAVKKLRSIGIKTPILMLTAKSEIEDKIIGLDSGADDYMTKPFEPEELLARLRALTRRQPDIIMDTLTYLDVTLDLNNNKLSCDERDVFLSHKEFELMKLLMKNKGNTLSIDQIVQSVWGHDSEAMDNNVQVYISFLRKKLKYVHSGLAIRTIRKVGYSLEVA